MLDPYSIRREGRDVHLVLRGHFSADAALGSTDAFRALVGMDAIRFIVYIGELDGYDKEARLAWQKVLAPMRKQISTIVFVGNASPLIRMAAATVALAVGLHMRFVARPEDIPK